MMWNEGRHSGEYQDGCGFISQAATLEDLPIAAKI